MHCAVITVVCGRICLANTDLMMLMIVCYLDSDTDTDTDKNKSTGTNTKHRHRHNRQTQGTGTRNTVYALYNLSDSHSGAEAYRYAGTVKQISR